MRNMASGCAAASPTFVIHEVVMIGSVVSPAGVIRNSSSAMVWSVVGSRSPSLMVRRMLSAMDCT